MKTMTNKQRAIRMVGLTIAAAAWVVGHAAFTVAAPPAGTWPMWGGTPSRNLVSLEKNMPVKWDVAKKQGVKWVSTLGSQSYGNPVIAGGKIFVGTNNELQRNPKVTGDKGVIMCFRQSDGEFLWQAIHDKLAAGRVNDWPEQGICSSGVVEGDRYYYVSNRCELVCVDTEGFMDGENDGPFKDEKITGPQAADFVWKLDMMSDELGVFPHNIATSSPVIVGDLVYLLTSNGVDEGHLNIPSPRAPSFLAVNKKTGELVWEDGSPADKILHGQWSSPAAGVVNGQGQVYFPGGDGWLYAFEPTGSADGLGKLIWKFDCNPKDSLWRLGGRGTRNSLIGTPVFHENRVYIAVGQDPEHGEGPGHLWAIDATGKGDVTESGRIWHVGGDDYNRTLSTVAIADGLLYASDLSGFLYCFDAKTGRKYWTHDVLGAVWGSPYVVDGKVYLGDEDGDVVVLEHGKTKKLLAENLMNDTVYGTPVAVDEVLYVMTRSRLYALVK